MEILAKYNYYLTKEGNILNVKKMCIHTIEGVYIERLTTKSNYLKIITLNNYELNITNLQPIFETNNIVEPDLNFWTHLWDIYEVKDFENNKISKIYYFFTRKKNNDYEFYLIENHFYSEKQNVILKDTYEDYYLLLENLDIDNIYFLELSELQNSFTSIEDVLALELKNLEVANNLNCKKQILFWYETHCQILDFLNINYKKIQI